MRFLKKLPIQILVFVVSLAANAFGESQNWPGFRGPGATGVLEGHSLPTTWNADPAAENPEGVLLEGQHTWTWSFEPGRFG